MPARVFGREKNAYSIWRKLQRKSIGFSQLSDIYAFRVITDTEERVASLCDRVASERLIMQIALRIVRREIRRELLLQEQRQEGKRLADLVGYCRGVVGFLRSARS